MSAYHSYETEYNDSECLAEALKEMGYDVQLHEEAKALEGYHGDKRSQKANIIVSRKSLGTASNDLGFVKGADGKYKMVLSEYDKGANFNSTKQKKLKTLYAEKESMKLAKARGMKFQRKENVVKNGKQQVRLVFTKA